MSSRRYLEFPGLICAWLLLLLAPARATDVIFRYGDFTSTPQQLRKIRLYPIPYGVPATNGQGRIITRDWQSLSVDTNASMIVSNVLIGSYRGEFAGTNSTTTNFFFFPATNALVDASDCIRAPLGVPGAGVAYSQVESDARYLPIGSNVVGLADLYGVQKPWGLYVVHVFGTNAFYAIHPAHR